MPGAGSGLLPAPLTGEAPLAKARGKGTDAAAAAAEDRDDAERETGLAGQPGQGGGKNEGQEALTRKPVGAGARRAGTAAGLTTVAEEEDEKPAEAEPAEADGAAAAQSAAGPEDPFDGMVDGFPGSFWTAVEEEFIEKPELLDWNHWQAWRKAEGGLPKGVRDTTVQLGLQGQDQEGSRGGQSFTATSEGGDSSSKETLHVKCSWIDREFESRGGYERVASSRRPFVA